MASMALTQHLFRSLGLALVKRRELLRLEKEAARFRKIDADLKLLFEHYAKSSDIVDCKSQLGQDVFALIANNFKKNGFFVEFGATNGVRLSNTYLLEKKYGWTGILAEPAIIWHEELIANRSAQIDFGCVWTNTGEVLDFDIIEGGGGLSTISQFSACDKHVEARRKSIKTRVETISLIDLLHKYHAPETIDYISLDTEGSEFDILSTFDFTKFKFNALTVEHNNTDSREKIFNLLTTHGYSRVFENMSKWDDWYIRSDGI